MDGGDGGRCTDGGVYNEIEFAVVLDKGYVARCGRTERDLA